MMEWQWLCQARPVSRFPLVGLGVDGAASFEKSGIDWIPLTNPILCEVIEKTDLILLYLEDASQAIHKVNA